MSFASAANLWLNRRRGRAGIFSIKPAAGNLHNVNKHLRSMGNGLQFGTSVVAGTHRHFPDGEPQTLRDHEQLCVKGPSGNTLEANGETGSAVAEGLNSRLRIGKSQTEKHPDDEIEAAAQVTPLERLPHLLQIRAQPA